jgi:hypothetical protein
MWMEKLRSIQITVLPAIHKGTFSYLLLGGECVCMFIDQEYVKNEDSKIYIKCIKAYKNKHTFFQIKATTL